MRTRLQIVNLQGGAMNRKVASMLFLTLALALGGIGPAAANRYHGGYYRGGWHPGYWHHGWHGGNWGWWWVTGGLWTLYAAPIYPYPNVVVVPDTSPPVVVQPNTPSSAPAGSAAGYWYYCRSPKGYYPYVRSCPGGWRPVEATPPGEVR
jgi:hypothetical protein